MLNKNIIEKLVSFWVLGVVLVKKKDGLLCFCVDYRWLNVIIVKDVYLLFRIDDFLDSFLGLKWFLIFDLCLGYW